jgi:hypothetical protein
MTILDHVQSARKAITAALVAGLTALAGVITTLPTGQGFGNVDLAGWIVVALAVLGGGGITYAIPNKPLPGSVAP